jgi:hypothetical protein
VARQAGFGDCGLPGRCGGGPAGVRAASPELNVSRQRDITKYRMLINTAWQLTCSGICLLVCVSCQPAAWRGRAPRLASSLAAAVRFAGRVRGVANGRQAREGAGAVGHVRQGAQGLIGQSLGAEGDLADLVIGQRKPGGQVE